MTVTFLALATTWLFVTMYPCGSMMKPDPSATIFCPGVRDPNGCSKNRCKELIEGRLARRKWGAAARIRSIPFCLGRGLLVQLD
jgi:hypothetical protein